MKESVRRILCSCIMAVFINFVFTNTVFMHVHRLNDGSGVVHSHPALPAVPHTHSADAFSLIAQCNLAAASIESTAQMPVAFTDNHWIRITGEPMLVAADCQVLAASLRAPPVEG